MAALTIFLCLSALSAISVFYAIRFPAGAQVAMQWGSDGKPTWRVPAQFAVSFTPVLALFGLGFTAIVGLGTTSPLPQLILIGEAVFLVVMHAAHMHFALRDQRRQT
jgi:hypothetical protein